MTSPSPETANNRTSENSDATSQTGPHTGQPLEEPMNEPERLFIQVIGTEEMPQSVDEGRTTTGNTGRSESSQMANISESRDNVSRTDNAGEILGSISELTKVLVNTAGHMLKIAETNQQVLSDCTAVMHQLNTRLADKDKDKDSSKLSTKSTDSGDRTRIAMPVPIR